MKKIIRLLFLLGVFLPVIISPKLSAKTELDENILAEYLKLQKEFSNESCKPGTEETFLELDKKYRGDGNFIPLSLDDKVDFKTIQSLIPLIKEKNLWIDAQIDLLKKNLDSKNLKFLIERLENNISLLLEAKKEYFFAKDKARRDNIEAKAAVQFKQLLKEVEKFKDQIPFLLSFKFPLDHLALRTEYEKSKNQNNRDERVRANSIYLFRKIVQDGSYDEDLVRTDAVIRSAFDTLYLSLNKDSGRSFLTDKERVDFHYVLNNFKKILSFKSDVLIARFNNWKARNERTLAFYEKLLPGPHIKIGKGQVEDLTSLLDERARSLYILKDFVLSREARTYEFWSKRSELLQSLFVIETILYSEVGRIDAPDALERRDVAQVVINRSSIPAYNQLTPKDSLLKYLSPELLKAKVKDNFWLNVLFKEGEFSFTYFYIPGNFHIYCPDMSRIGQFLRSENFRSALELLNKPRTNFTALRYFSRTGMFGRIEMDSLWDKFRMLPEVPGKPVRNPHKIYDQFKHDHYKFLYDFSNEDLKKSFLVVDLKGKIYVIDSKDTKQIYYYRNPHQFKYFTLLK